MYLKKCRDRRFGCPLTAGQSVETYIIRTPAKLVFLDCRGFDLYENLQGSNLRVFALISCGCIQRPVRRQAKSVILARHTAQVAELGEFFAEAQVYGAGGTVSMLGNDNFCLAFFVGIFVIVFITIDKHYNIGVLL